MTEIQINGLKISGELCLIRLHHSTPDIHRLPAFCGIMAGSQINLPFISTVHHAKRYPGCLLRGCQASNADQTVS